MKCIYIDRIMMRLNEYLEQFSNISIQILCHGNLEINRISSLFFQIIITRGFV